MLLCRCRFDFEKFNSTVQDVKHGLQERLNQWAEYESQFEKLINWLNESETALKNYTPKASLEEKIEQQDRYQVHIKNH